MKTPVQILTDVYFCGTGNIVHYGGDSAAQHWNRKLNLTDLCIKHIVEYSVTFITVKDRVCINLNALKRSEHFFLLFLCLWMGLYVYHYQAALFFVILQN